VPLAGQSDVLALADDEDVEDVEPDEDDDDDDFGVEDDDEVLSLLLVLPSLLDDEDDDAVAPLAEALDARESVMYQPLPLNTMPTGWITLRSAPPHCSQVVRGGSEKLWRFSITSLQAVQV
jgi:hypothetical protein